MAARRKANQYAEEFSEPSLWRKIGKYAAAAGKQIVEKVLVLFYCMRDKDTPAWAKTVIIGALGYFILPTDAIPDIIPVVGYTDDMGALAMAMGLVAMHIKPEHHTAAKEKLKQWFGES